MYVRCIDPAGLKEAESCADAETSEDGESLDISGLSSSALGVGCRCSIVEGENSHLLKSLSSEQSLSRGKQTLEALDGRRSTEEIAEERSWVFSRSWGWSWSRR